VSFKIADGGDLWFHAKNVPGSHVIVKTGGRDMESLPDRLFIEAAELAAFYSSHKEDAKVEIDYTVRKNLKKVPNAAPGFVIYHTNWSVTVEPKNELELI
jgi:predicted ribosome quality control (RQC) complex YloA/Tae2 family protein